MEPIAFALRIFTEGMEACDHDFSGIFHSGIYETSIGMYRACHAKLYEEMEKDANRRSKPAPRRIKRKISV